MHQSILVHRNAWLYFVLAILFMFAQENVYAAKRDRGPPGRNKAPVIKGTPSSEAVADEYYSFQPSAHDRNRDNLRFYISNKPQWAAFDESNGYLSGYPSAEDAGSTAANIVISVTDGQLSDSLSPFSITVASGTAPNAPPTIGGTPPAEILESNAYQWTPTASDPDGDALDFSVANLPLWASFDSMTGRISGTPDAGHVGLYDNIQIVVSDGHETASTGAFSIEVLQSATGAVTLSWVAPVENTDGSALTDLAAYRIYYGSSSGQYDQQLDLSDPGTTTVVIENLSAGAWYFRATAINEAGVESEMSEELARTVL